MKTNKNRSKTTITSLVADLNRWYGSSWWKSGLVMTAIFTLAVVIPGLLR